jgi:hypothetical protein
MSQEQQEKIQRQNLIDVEKISLGNTNNSNLVNNNTNKNFINISDNNVFNSQKEPNKIIIPNNEINSNYSNISSSNFNENDNKVNNIQKKNLIIFHQNLNYKNNNTKNSVLDSPNPQELNNNNNNINNNNSSITNYSPSHLRKIKQIENILTQKIVNITELRSIAWKGLPYGKNNLI